MCQRDGRGGGIQKCISILSGSQGHSTRPFLSGKSVHQENQGSSPVNTLACA